jgi:hypothetical protein
VRKDRAEPDGGESPEKQEKGEWCFFKGEWWQRLKKRPFFSLILVNAYKQSNKLLDS